MARGSDIGFLAATSSEEILETWLKIFWNNCNYKPRYWSYNSLLSLETKIFVSDIGLRQTWAILYK